MANYTGQFRFANGQVQGLNPATGQWENLVGNGNSGGPQLQLNSAGNAFVLGGGRIDNGDGNVTLTPGQVLTPGQDAVPADAGWMLQSQAPVGYGPVSSQLQMADDPIGQAILMAGLAGVGGLGASAALGGAGAATGATGLDAITGGGALSDSLAAAQTGGAIGGGAAGTYGAAAGGVGALDAGATGAAGGGTGVFSSGASPFTGLDAITGGSGVSDSLAALQSGGALGTGAAGTFGAAAPSIGLNSITGGANLSDSLAGVQTGGVVGSGAPALSPLAGALPGAATTATTVDAAAKAASMAKIANGTADASDYLKVLGVAGAALADATKNNSSSVQTQYPPWYTAGATDAVSKAMAIPGYTPYTPNTDRFMNPYIQGALDPAAAAVNRDFDTQKNTEQAKAAMQGAFGGSRATLADQTIDTARGTALDNIYGPGYANAYNNAQSLDVQDQNASRNWPITQVGALATALRGTGDAGKTTTTTPAAPSLIGGVTGALGALDTAQKAGIF